MDINISAISDVMYLCPLLLCLLHIKTTYTYCTKILFIIEVNKYHKHQICEYGPGVGSYNILIQSIPHLISYDVLGLV